MGRHKGIDLPDPASLDWLSIESVDKLLQLPGESKLGLGELGVLTLAEKIPGSLAVIDDGLASGSV